MSECRVSASFLRDLVFHAASAGADAVHLLRSAGIDSSHLAKPDELVSSRRALALWRAAVEVTGDHDLGLHLGERAHPSALGLLAPVLLNAPTLGEAIEKMRLYARLLIDAIELRVVEGDGWCEIEFSVTDADHNYVREEPRQPMECTVAAFVTLAGRLAGRPLPLERAAFRHAAPSSTAEHERILRCAVSFGAAQDRVRFDALALRWPVLFSDDGLLARHEQQVCEALHATSNERAVTARTRKVVAALLRGTVPTLDDVARRLGMSDRSLQRALKDEATSFSAVLDDVRKDLALWHLRSNETSIAQVALLLGFSEASAFHRSFKRWTGSTPRAHRAGR